ncbi:MAG: hypothetical protein A2802_00685 [Candidatus Woykebacteria bacterium RIFCSPHIGHO2_01_FULL_43_29]|uniref:Pseudouridine synthase n=2 Tax=Candidatus Woykeibacteriota TaxID=1817899 RepID=A0A1G1WXZ0_9BACT|nr:MAG: hypothetical protein A2802_00685 [Candidatus Woykebacteria bacterium RIFCSPHIGHO2_01_FULL_43_29]OGY30004.1 MAG: hypothetical protein A3J50_02890 [Candidatus Woykebacteria bacterium RIFCSPHIGHO2_02_FULL_43_16b]OGY32007.1 MAG: hypothetical protein A3A61_01145 [Candidatus Woykebacteria bacterium RIFCSPLOWO2_01_FULL_43_14]
MESSSFEIKAHGEDRLDKYLSQSDVGVSRSRIKKLINLGLITVSSKKVTPSYRLAKNDVIKGIIPSDLPTRVVGENIPLDIIYEDQDCLVINKPAGLVVHPAAGHPGGTLVNAILYHLKALPSSDLRIGIVHRLDKDTSGVMVVAKNQLSETALKKQFQERVVKKVYLCLVEGKLDKDSGSVNKPIGRHPKNRQKFATTQGGKEAQTDYKKVKSYGQFSLVEVQPLTGRTHQIRVHLASIGHPLVGDKTYGHSSNIFGLERQFLHSQELSFKQPSSGEKLIFQAPLPRELRTILDKLE